MTALAAALRQQWIATCCTVKLACMACSKGSDTCSARPDDEVHKPAAPTRKPAGLSVKAAKQCPARLSAHAGSVRLLQLARAAEAMGVKQASNRAIFTKQVTSDTSGNVNLQACQDEAGNACCCHMPADLRV